MDTTAFLEQLPSLWDGDPQHTDHPRDRRFLPVIETTRGLVTENTLAMLNLAAQQLEDGEVYLEVGAWAGCSIIGASLGVDHRFVTIDNFSEFDGTAEECRRNLEHFDAHHVELLDGDVWEVLASTTLPGPVGVYFYDGGHTFDDQYRALKTIEPLLADEALVVIDDTRWSQVAAANRLFVQRRPQFRRVLAFTSPWNQEPRWWNGIEVYTYRRALGPGRPPSTLSYVWTRTTEATRQALKRGPDPVGPPPPRQPSAVRTFGERVARKLRREAARLTSRREPPLEVDEIIDRLGLEPHPTCGFVAETYRSTQRIAAGGLGIAFADGRPVGSALYFLVTPERPVRLHRIHNDQLYHRYLGDALEVLALYPDGSHAVHTVGSNVAGGELLQLFLPGGTFHTARLRAGGQWFLGSSTEWPGVEPPDVELGNARELAARFPAAASLIESFVGD
jgi:predicted cupin superfamily sugar epimerase/predicted O-methyltransferase YrrM